MLRQLLLRLLSGRDDKLILAAERGQLDQVRTYLEAGADPNARSKDSFTVLMWAAARSHVEVVKLLLEAGVDLNARTRKGRTAIEIAAQEGHHDIAKILLEAGAEHSGCSPA
jgi:ankyrin repeat protein